jgi:hypothetical protein
MFLMEYPRTKKKGKHHELKCVDEAASQNRGVRRTSPVPRGLSVEQRHPKAATTCGKLHPSPPNPIHFQYNFSYCGQ